MASEIFNNVMAKVKKYKTENPDQFKKVVKKKEPATSKKRTWNVLVVGATKKDGLVKTLIIQSGNGESRGTAKVPADMQEALKPRFNMKQKEPTALKKFTAQVLFDEVTKKGTLKNAVVDTVKKVAFSECK